MKNFVMTQSPIYPTSLALYITPSFGIIDTNNFEQIKKLRDDVILECQGDFVQFDSSDSIIESLVAFDAIRTYCSEVIVKNGDSAIGIYDRHHTDIIRPLATKFVIYHKREYFQDELIPEINVDLEILWKHAIGNTEYERINNSIEIFFKNYKPTRGVTFIGTVPLALIFSLQYSLYGICVELWYQSPSELNNIAIKIF